MNWFLKEGDDTESKQPKKYSLKDFFAGELRRERRYPCTESLVAVYSLGDPEPFSAWVVNVSKSGLRLQAERSLWPGHQVTISFADPNRSNVIRAECRYCHSEQEGIYEIGLEITNFVAPNNTIG
jgi:hypothetical protein